MRDPEPASGLLDVTNRAELEHFLRSLVGGRLPASVDRKLVDVLATTAVRTVPTLHALVGNGKPPAPRVYGLALEGMSAEDRDYELARQFARFARAAADRVASTPTDVAAAVEHAAREFAPELAHLAGPAGKETRMFETETQPAQYEEAEYGGRRRRRRRFDDDEYEGGGYGQYGETPYEAEDGRYGEAMYEAENGGYGESQYEEENAYESNGYGEAEFDEAEEEERFLPLIPLAGKVLGGLLGRLMKEGESEFDEAEEEGEDSEAEEEFLDKLVKKILGREAEHDELAMSPAQEAQFAGQFMEIDSEEELESFLNKLVNFVGRTVQGARRAASSPQGRALIEAVKPLARSALPALGGVIGGAIAPGIGSQVGRTIGTAASTLFETESSMMSEEEAEFETARQFVRLASGAAQDVAYAPPGAPARMVGEFSVARRLLRRAPGFRSRTLRAMTPFARRFFGSRGFRGRFRPGFRPGPSFRRFPVRGPRFGLRPRFGFGVPIPVAEPEPLPEPPGPPAPGFRWVAVPIGAPDPVPAAAPAEPPPTAEPTPAASEYEYSGNGHGQGQGGRWVRRNGKIVVLGA